MQNFEVGILPQSICFSFSPSAQVQKLFYYPIWCGHYYCNEEYYIKRKTYPPLLLVYVCEGSLFVELESEGYEANAGQVILLDCQQPHYYYAKKYVEFFYIHFDGPQAHEVCKYLTSINGGILFQSENTQRIRQELEDIVQFYENGNSESAIASSSRIYHLFTQLDNPNRSLRLQKNDDSINRTVAYIRKNVGKKMSLQELAKLSGLSVYYFSHLFKELTGQSPTEFVIHSRIDQAKILLVNTNLSIAEIAQQVGYPNSGNLITLFTQRVGCSPSQFRKDTRHGM